MCLYFIIYESVLSFQQILLSETPRVLVEQIRPSEEKNLDQNPLPRFLFSGLCQVNCNRISIPLMMAEGREVEVRSKETNVTT